MPRKGRRLRLLWVAIPVAVVAAGIVIILLAGTHGGGSGPKPRPGDERAEGLVDVRSVTYRSAFDNTDVTGLAAIPRGVKSRGCVIWQYGFRSTKELSHFAWQPLAALGLTTFSIDFRFHGARGSGEADYQEISEKPAKFRAMMRGTLADLRSAID